MVSTRPSKEYFLKQRDKWHEEQNPRLASDLHKLHTQAHTCACTCAHIHIYTPPPPNIAGKQKGYPLLRYEHGAGSYRNQRSRLGTRPGSKLEGGLLGNGATQRTLPFLFLSSFVLHLLCPPQPPLCWAIKAGSSTRQTLLLRCISGCRFLLCLVSPKGCFTRV